VDFSCFGYHPDVESRLTLYEKWVLGRNALDKGRWRLPRRERTTKNPSVAVKPGRSKEQE
jgi:hypothetical protein